MPTKKLLTVFIVFISAAVLFNSCKKNTNETPPPNPPVIKAPAPFGFYVVGYFPSYRNLNDIPDVKFRMCNVINYAFFQVTADGLLGVNNELVFNAVINKARANNAKIFISVNDGKGDGTGYFTAMAATATGRNKFIVDVMKKVRQYKVDGIDIDWEFPSATNGTATTYLALMKELSDSLHVDGKYYLTTAITAGKYAGGYRDAVTTELVPYVDFFNIMAYDDFSTTVQYKHHSDYALAQTCLNFWLNKGFPKEKLVLGLPAYGRPSGITQSGTIKTYAQILAAGGDSQKDSAIVSATSYPSYTVYYNGQYTIKRKTMLAKTSANGVMLWEKGQDTHDNYSLLKAVCDTLGRTY